MLQEDVYVKTVVHLVYRLLLLLFFFWGGEGGVCGTVVVHTRACVHVHGAWVCGCVCVCWREVKVEKPNVIQYVFRFELVSRINFHLVQFTDLY